MQWLLDNSPWIIGLVGVVHVVCFLLLWHNRTKQARRLEAHLRNIVGTFSTHMDVDPYSTLDEKIDGFPNYHFFTSAPASALPKLMLERGINATADVIGPDGRRRPACAVPGLP